MKFVAFILSFYLLALAVLPCTDQSGKSKYNKEEVTISASADCQDDHQTGDVCTPFCVCSCCQIATNAPAHDHQTAILPKEAILGTSLFFYVKEVTLSFWQPPKIQC